MKLQNYVDTAFKEEFFHVLPTERPEYNGTQLINAKVIASYLRQLLRNDLQYAPFTMEGMEEPVNEIMEIETPQGKLALNIGGTIDRMDSKGDTLRIVDYKTGGSPQNSREYRATVHSCRRTSELYFPDFPVRFHHVPQTIVEGCPFLALHSPCSIRNLFSCN